MKLHYHERFFSCIAQAWLQLMSIGLNSQLMFSAVSGVWHVSQIDWLTDRHPHSVVKRAAGLYIISQDENAFICLAELTMPETQLAASTVLGISRRECVCVRLHSSLLGHVWAWVTENINWSRSVECGSKRAPCLFMYFSAQELSAHPTTCRLISKPIFKWPLHTWIEARLVGAKLESKCVERVP